MNLDDLTRVATEFFWQNPTDPDDDTMPCTATGAAHTVCQRYVPKAEDLARLCVEIHYDARIGGDTFSTGLDVEGNMPEMFTIIVSDAVEKLMRLDPRLKQEDHDRLQTVE